MTSLRQIEANRRNALKTTGPTTTEGKARPRRNAIRHGLTAETVIAALEGAEDCQAFEGAVTADYDAESAIERELVLRLASVLWRLRRATGIETALFESVTAEPGKVDKNCSRLTLVGAVDVPEQNQLGIGAEARQSDAAAANKLTLNVKKISQTVSCARQSCRRFLWIVSVAMSACCGDRQVVFTLESLRTVGSDIEVGSSRSSTLRHFRHRAADGQRGASVSESGNQGLSS